eukprot:14042801-Heterocapsa_arctica.AAC.1
MVRSDGAPALVIVVGPRVPGGAGPMSGAISGGLAGLGGIRFSSPRLGGGCGWLNGVIFRFGQGSVWCQVYAR